MSVRHKILLFFFLSLFLSVCILTASAEPNPDDGGIYYIDIPGVTEEDRANIESIKRQYPDGLIYGMIYSEEAFITTDGEIGGYAQLVCQRLSNLFGLKITPKILEWDSLIASLRNGSVDLTGDLTSTPARRETYFMTSPIAERSFAVFRNAKRPPLDLFSSERTLRYGFLEHTTTYDRVLETSMIPFKAVFVPDYKQAAEGLQDGTIDGFIYESAADSILEYYPNIDYQEYYPVVFTSVSLATANPNLRPLIDAVQKYLEHGGKQELSGLYEQGKEAYQRQKLNRLLTPEEQAYLDSHIQNHISIPVAAEFDNYPISFYNQQERQWQGIAHDILRKVQSLTGLRFEITTGTDEPWHSILEKLKNGDTAIITNLLKSKDRSGHYLWPDAPYSVDSYALLSRMDTEDMTISQASMAKVGLLAGTAYQETFQRIFPDHQNFILYPDALQCFEALESGEVDLVMMPRHLLLSITNYMERPGFKVNVALNIPCESYFGFNQEEDILCSIISKAQTLVGCEEITDRWERRVFDYNKKLTDQRIPYLIGISLLLLVILILMVILYHQRERSSRRLAMTDPLTSLYNRRYYEQQLKHEWFESIKYRIPISLLTIDLDRFKEYNDAYGHPQGDLLLRTVAGIFKGCLTRPPDFAARIGGDEFAVLLPNTKLQEAVFVAKKIRSEVENTVIKTSDGKATSITVSIGTACTLPSAYDKLSDFIAASDQTLYRAKKEGSNRVCSSSCVFDEGQR